MNNKLIYRGFAAISFVVTFITYMLTAQPSTPFWDCGEFTSAITWQQVPHPPGSPLFLMAGKIVQMVFPFGDMNFRGNMLSVFATAFSVLLLYLVIVKTINWFRKQPVESLADSLLVYGSALVGALAFCFTDTLWFNGVESEVYASTTVLTMICVYLMMRWNEMADQPGHERYLILLAYLIVLSSGVHLLAILTVFSIVMLVYFRKYHPTPKNFILMGIIALVVFGAIYKIIIPMTPTFLAGYISSKAIREGASPSYFFKALPYLSVIGASLLLWWSLRNKKPVFAICSAGFVLMMVAYTINFHVIIRANSNPPLNENAPKTWEKLVSYLGREQYGESKNWPRRFSQEQRYIRYYEEWNGHQFGKWTPPDDRGEFSQVNLGGELSYMWHYQMNHMFFRYFFWNFVGRESDVQDASWALTNNNNIEALNFNNGYASEFPIKFYGLPLILGLIGLFYHYKRDKKTWWVFLIMFLLMGVLAAIAQSQLMPQPRERDYFYTGSFAVFCLWIGIGAYYLAEWLRSKKDSAAVVGGSIVVSMLLVPVIMGANGWKMHSRAGNYLPFDFAYNILQSCEKDAILFTVGDNDTFPLWNIQDVLGVRRDVRVVNLSLGGTEWYCRELRDRQPWGAKSIPLTILDNQELFKNNYVVERPKELRVNVPLDVMRKYTSNDSILANPTFNITYRGRNQSAGKDMLVYMVDDMLIWDIIKSTKFERPVYFCATAAYDAQQHGLDRFLRNEGMAMRLCPVEQVGNNQVPAYDDKITMDCLVNNVDNSNNYSTDQHYGFKFRNLNNMDVYYDDVHRKYLESYRDLYLQFSSYLVSIKKDTVNGIKVIDKMMEQISPTQFPLLYNRMIQIARLYKDAGAHAQAEKYAKLAMTNAKLVIDNPHLRNAQSHTLYEEFTGRGRNGVDGAYKSLAAAYSIIGDYDNAVAIYFTLVDKIQEQMAKVGNNKSAKQEVELYQRNIGSIISLIIYMSEDRLKDIKSQKGDDAAAAEGEKMVAKFTERKDEFSQVVAQQLQLMIKKFKGENIAELMESAQE